jgi:Putative auto-transporter adhesin, head GIN domain
MHLLDGRGIGLANGLAGRISPEEGGAMTAAPTPLHRREPHHPRLLLAALLALGLAGVVIWLLFHYDAFNGSSSSTAVEGSGVAAVQTRDLSAFSTIELAGSNTVTIAVGGEQAVAVHADDNLLSHVTTQVSNGRLVVGNTPGSFTTKSPMRVEIRIPSLTALSLTGSGVVAATGVDASRLTVTLAGSGVLRASGTTGRLDVALSGSGDAQLEQLVARDVQAIVSGSGRILVNATKTLDASVPGSGEIMYTGNPAHVATDITGSGTVTPG